MAGKGTKSDPIIDKKKVIEGERSAQPTGVKIERRGSRFTVSWERGKTHDNKDYKSQKLKVRRQVNGKDKDWVSVSVTASANSGYKQYSLSDYYPNTSAKLTAVKAVVSGVEKKYTETKLFKKDDKWHKRDEEHNFDDKDVNGSDAVLKLSPPQTPSISGVTPGSGTTVFAYSVSGTGDDSKTPFADVEYETRLVHKHGNSTKGISWESGKTGYTHGTKSTASGSVSCPYDTSLTTVDDSWTHAIRMRARGAAGHSEWTYKSYVYAWPLKIKNDKLKAEFEQKTAAGFWATITWEPNRNDNHPVETARVEYVIAVPRNTSLDVPNNVSWTTGADNIKDINGKAACSFYIGQTIQKDYAMWVRVVQKHSANGGTFETPGNAKLVKFGGVKGLVSGSAITVDSYNSSNGQLTVSVANPSEISGSRIFIAVDVYDPRIKMYVNKCWKKLAAGTTSHTFTNTDLKSYSKWQIFAKIVAGEYESNAKYITFIPARDATNPAAFKPTSIRAKPVENSAGNVKITWKNVMQNVTAAEVSIATDPNEWTYANPDFVIDETASGTGISSTVVTGLSYNTQYYCKVKTTNSNGSSEWSDDTASFKIKSSSAPVPELTASGALDSDKKPYISVKWNWDKWTQADSLILYWADNSQTLDTELSASQETVKRGTKSGAYTFNIDKDVERGNTYYIQARFASGGAETDPSEVVTVDFPVDVTPPTFVTAERSAQPYDEEGESSVIVTWDNPWEDADTTEVSWSDNPNAWESTEGPSTITLDDEKGRDTSLLVSGLEMGKTWYFRVRLIYDKFSTTHRDSPIGEADLATDPAKPVLTLSDALIAPDGKTDLSWTYSCEDGAEQAAADIRILNSSGTVIKTLSSAGTETGMTLYAADNSLAGDNVYSIQISTRSGNGRSSEWSDEAGLTVQNRPVVTITDTSLEEVTVTEDQTEYTVTALTEMPLTVSVTGAENGGTVTAYIERSEPFFKMRPDETESSGFEGELVALVRIDGNGTVTIGRDDLRSFLDDDAGYRLIVLITDNIGTSDPAVIDFTVMWEHQALEPVGTWEPDDEKLIVKISTEEPEGAAEGDAVDIYRLSADKPELIVRGGVLGETYVDPYPAFGDGSGHRIVYVTANGDYTTEDKTIAWLDLDGSVDAEGEDDPVGRLDSDHTIIDFGGSRVELKYNMDLSNSWEKDFTETKYLGGSVQGDWNPAVSRKTAVNSVMLTLADQESIKQMRRLAVWPGICHVRTPEGSSFAADIQVSESRSYQTGGKTADFSLTVTRVDSEALEGVILEEWEADNELE